MKEMEKDFPENYERVVILKSVWIVGVKIKVIGKVSLKIGMHLLAFHTIYWS